MSDSQAQYQNDTMKILWKFALKALANQHDVCFNLLSLTPDTITATDLAGDQPLHHYQLLPPHRWR